MNIMQMVDNLLLRALGIVLPGNTKLFGCALSLKTEILSNTKAKRKKTCCTT